MKQSCVRLFWLVALSLVGVITLAQAGEEKKVDVTADVEIGKKAGTTESTTLIVPGPDGTTAVINKETVTHDTVQRVSRPVEASLDPASRKARVVVMPALWPRNMTQEEVRRRGSREFREALYQKLGLPAEQDILETPGFTSFIVDALVNTHKVDVLEREELRSAIKELDFGETDYADMNKVVKIGQMLNADYVVIPEIRYFSLVTTNMDVPYIGGTQKEVRGKLATNVRTVDVATSKIVASNISSQEGKTRFRDRKGPEWQQMRDFVATLYSGSATAESANIIDTAYPIKVVGVSETTITINRGNGAVVKGDILNVYETGEMMIDPDTKESLGFHETLMGKARVVEVDEKTAKAELIQGQGKVKKLFICRREKKLDDTPVQSPAPKLD